MLYSVSQRHEKLFESKYIGDKIFIIYAYVMSALMCVHFIIE